MVIGDFKNSEGLWADYYKRDVTFSRIRWRNMMARCKVGGTVQTKNPTYIGCSCSEDFKDFQKFSNWHVEQVGYALPNYQLDKDLLIGGNLLYSSNTCCIIPKTLNMFAVEQKALRGEFPSGVCYEPNRESSKKFTASVSIDGKKKYLGSFYTPDEAYAVYKEAKEEEARRWCTRLEDGEFIVDQRVIERLRTWTIPCND